MLRVRCRLVRTRLDTPFQTLRVLFATQSVANCIPTQSVRNDNLNYRARCSALLPEGRGSELAHEGAGAGATIVRRSASHAFS